MISQIRTLAHVTSPEFRRDAYRDIGAALRRERERRGLGLRELARMAGVDASNLSTIEHGRMASRPALYRALEVLETVPVKPPTFEDFMRTADELFKLMREAAR